MFHIGGCLRDHVFPFSRRPFDGVLPTEGKTLHPLLGGLGKVGAARERGLVAIAN
jgi:hypothetical protein